MDTQFFQKFCGAAATTIGIGSFLIYIRGIFRHNEKPHIFSWILWCLLTLIIWYAQFTKNAGPAAWTTLVSALFCGIIAVCAWRRGEKNITRSDWVVFIIGLSAIPLWYTTKNPLPAVILLSAIDFMSIYPTFRKSLINPWEENMQFYGINIIKWALAFFAIQKLIVVNWLYPVSLFLQNMTLFAAIYLIRRKQEV